MIKTFLSAALVSLTGFGGVPAAAAPTSVRPLTATSELVQVQAGRYDKPDARDRHRDHEHFTPGHRYHRAPAHWRRYHSRPHHWHRRGCIIVGPLWFCP